MNGGLKHWKEAATLIVAAGRRLSADTLSRFDYDVLLLKRSSRSGFMPNAHVFPGGMVDSSDFSSEWLHVFRSVRGSPGFGLRRVAQPARSRPPLFATDRLQLGSPVPGEVAFRICALRETFEESGVLLVVPEPEVEAARGGWGDRCAPLPRCSLGEKLRGGELSRWRTLVNQDPSNFIRMCRELQVLPNIWALHEWGNWLTPAGRYGGARFDTAFFICCLQEAPHTLHDDKEIVRFQWSTPSEILRSYRERELWIAPPQFYELSRMCRFPSLNDLHNFSSKRATEGCEQWLPVIVSKDEHYISLLPGDRLYPSDPSGHAQVDTQAETEDPQDDSGLHRIVISDPYSATLQVTITPKYNHVVPVVWHDSESQP